MKGFGEEQNKISAQRRLCWDERQNQWQNVWYIQSYRATENIIFPKIVNLCFTQFAWLIRYKATAAEYSLMFWLHDEAYRKKEI